MWALSTPDLYCTEFNIVGNGRDFRSEKGFSLRRGSAVGGGEVQKTQFSYEMFHLIRHFLAKMPPSPRGEGMTTIPINYSFGFGLPLKMQGAIPCQGKCPKDKGVPVSGRSCRKTKFFD